MPIVDVELVADDEPGSGLAQQLADAIAPVLGEPPGSTWVRVRCLPRSSYAEDGGAVPLDVRPVFVTVLVGRELDIARLADESKQVTEAVARATNHPSQNVHVVWDADARGRVAFGGRLVPPAG